MIKKTLILLFTLFACSVDHFAEYVDKFGVGAVSSSNTKDFFIGLDGYIPLFSPGYLYLSPFFTARPFKKNIFTESSEGDILYQIQESRYNFGATLASHYPVAGSFGIAADLGGAFSYSNFHGLKTSTNSQLSPIVRLGVYYSIVKLQYEYFPLKNTPDHRIILGAAYFFSLKGKGGSHE